MLKENFQKFIKNKTGNNNKKNIENLVVFLILLIVTIIAINTIWSKDENKSKIEEDEYRTIAKNNTNSSNISQENEYDLEDRLEDILSKMNGVGNVNVLITYSQTSAVVPMYSETESTSITEETDSARRN